MQCAIYCEDHKEQAEQIEKIMWEGTKEIPDGYDTVKS
jgi:hypothetical protein